MPLKYSLLLSFVTTFIALIAMFIVLPENSGYAGLYFMGLSPLLFLIIAIWNFILWRLININYFFKKLLMIIILTVLSQYIFFVFFIAEELIEVSISDDFGLFIIEIFDLMCESAVCFVVLSYSITFSLVFKYYILPKISNK